MKLTMPRPNRLKDSEYLVRITHSMRPYITSIFPILISKINSFGSSTHSPLYRLAVFRSYRKTVKRTCILAVCSVPKATSLDLKGPESETPKTSKGEVMQRDIPSQADKGVWGSVVTPGGARGEAMDEMEFCKIRIPKKQSCS